MRRTRGRPRGRRPIAAALGLVLSVALGACASVQTTEGASAPAERAPLPETTETPATPSVLDGIYTAQQASRGEARFEGVCTVCHQSNEFTGSRFRLRWAGETIDAMYDLISTSMPEGNPGSLNPRQYIDIIAYLLSLNDYPAGEEELTPDRSALNGLVIEEVTN